MIKITLPDNSIRTFNEAITVLQIAQTISPSLAKATLAGIVNDKLVDASHLITQDAKLTILTTKSTSPQEAKQALEIIRHSTAHLLAQAVKQLYQTAQVTIGPVIEDGFYYDISYERPFNTDDLACIEKRMHELAHKNIPIQRLEMSRNEAISYFTSIGEHYKVEIIKQIPENEVLSLYRQDDFTDLCRGAHVPSTGKLTAFKLIKLAGAYWRGDSNNEMLQRIYGTAWQTKEELTSYLRMIEEASKRDHRKFATSLDLFHIQDDAPGMIFWHPNGYTLWQVIEQYMRQMFIKYDYLEVKTPQIVDKSLWEKSGHWDKYREDMFSIQDNDRTFAIKPMNCPCHVQIFNKRITSYKELPIRLAEFGSCHRNESSGSLHGLMRVRGFTQDDAHIFCKEDQIASEVATFCDMAFAVYKKFGLNDVNIKLATRPKKRIGSDETWDKAEAALANALKSKELTWEVVPEDGAFYGPKVEFVVSDSIGRKWTTGTIQLDFMMPQRLGARYVDSDNTHKIPVMLHRAICGSMERFIGILLEHYEGKLPAWLAPIQVVVLGIASRHDDYVNKVAHELRAKHAIRCNVDLSNEKMGYKIRQHTVNNKVPFLVIVGDSEQSNQTVSVRRRNGDDLGTMSVSSLAHLVS